MDAREVDAHEEPGRPGDELRQAAVTLRTLATPNRSVPMPAFAPFAVAGLLEALGDALNGGCALPDPVCRSALQVARHLRAYPPPTDTPRRTP